MKIENDKLICTDCRTISRESEMLKAINPFDKTQKIMGCPNCFAVDQMLFVCDEPGCNRESTCGTPTPEDSLVSYRTTCSAHAPREKTK